MNTISLSLRNPVICIAIKVKLQNPAPPIDRNGLQGARYGGISTVYTMVSIVIFTWHDKVRNGVLTSNRFEMLSLLYLCVLSRLVIMSVAVIGNILLEDHRAEGVEPAYFDQSSVFEVILSTFSKWDAVYFLNISYFWYQQDTHYVFYPLYPSCIKLFGHFLGCWFEMEERTAHVIAAVSISNICFIIAFVTLRKMYAELNFSKICVDRISLLFICTPANIFFVSAYSESLYAMLAWTGMLHIQRRQDLMGAVCLMLASLTRSNGIFNAVFVLVALLQRLAALRDWRESPGLCGLAVICVCVCLPYAVFSHYAYNRICFQEIWGLDDVWGWEWGGAEGTCGPSGGGLLSCNDLGQRSQSLFGQTLAFLNIFPSLQRAHWQVGWLTQYQLKQIPNFCLAAPVLALTAYTLQPLLDLCTPNHWQCALSRTLKSPLLPHLCHLVCLGAVCVGVAHVQVSTRVLLSGCPILYMSLGHLAFADHTPWRGRVWIYVILFNVLGVLGHPNFYPWT